MVNSGIGAEDQSPPIPAVLLFGPTGVGKSDILLRLFPGRGEIISADSMQVYRGMDVGTAKPDPALRAVLPHHLLDIRDPWQGYSVGEFVADADRLAAEIVGRGLLPVVSGGTAFYFKNLLLGLPATPPSLPRVREQLRAELAERGPLSLHAELAGVDPMAAERISAKDAYRILRALEVVRITGLPLSQFTLPSAVREGFRFLVIGLERERSELYRRIDVRVDRMFERGLVGEVRKLLAAGCSFEDPGMKGIGYHELAGRIDGTAKDLEEARELIKRNSRRYAKRQITFFRSLPLARWYHAEDEAGIREAVAHFVDEIGLSLTVSMR